MDRKQVGIDWAPAGTAPGRRPVVFLPEGGMEGREDPGVTGSLLEPAQGERAAEAGN